MRLFETIFVQIADPNIAPEVLMVREWIRAWRFYDQLRTDADAPCRIPQLGTRTPVLSHDGSDLAAAIQTIFEIGDPAAVSAASTKPSPALTLKSLANPTADSPSNSTKRAFSAPFAAPNFPTAPCDIFCGSQPFSHRALPP